MESRLYRPLVFTALVLTLVWIGWTWYDSFGNRPAGVTEYMVGNNAFEDGDYDKALAAFEQSLQLAPEKPYALNMRATTLLQLGRTKEALAGFNRVLKLAPDFAGGYALRGILHDREGRHEQALADYEQAILIDTSDLQGPQWLTRFMRNQAKAPPNVMDRARYLRQQLALKPEDRLLRLSEQDAKQRSYKVD